MTKELTEQFRIAEEIAREVHKGQKRFDGKNYITHIEAVVNSHPEVEFKIVAKGSCRTPDGGMGLYPFGPGYGREDGAKPAIHQNSERGVE